MSKFSLIALLESVLNKGKITSNNNVAFNCPFCNHHKKKLEIDIVTQHWHCWVCNAAGRKLTILFRKLNVQREKISKLIKLLDDVEYKPTKTSTDTPVLHLPEGYRPLWSLDTTSPARAYYKEDKWKHKNPPTSKDIVGFELHINWDMPIVLVEGAFDAIAIKRNAIPLFGKTISNTLKKRIVEKGVKQIYICLDQDAKKQALETAEYFMANGIDIYFVDLTSGDPSELGFEKIKRILESTTKMSTEQLMEQKILCAL
jgi:transcription elongation factor Elf1